MYIPYSLITAINTAILSFGVEIARVACAVMNKPGPLVKGGGKALSHTKTTRGVRIRVTTDN